MEFTNWLYLIIGILCLVGGLALLGTSPSLRMSFRALKKDNGQDPPFDQRNNV